MQWQKHEKPKFHIQYSGQIKSLYTDNLALNEEKNKEPLINKFKLK